MNANQSVGIQRQKTHLSTTLSSNLHPNFHKNSVTKTKTEEKNNGYNDNNKNKSTGGQQYKQVQQHCWAKKFRYAMTNPLAS